MIDILRVCFRDEGEFVCAKAAAVSLWYSGASSGGIHMQYQTQPVNALAGPDMFIIGRCFNR